MNWPALRFSAMDHDRKFPKVSLILSIALLSISLLACVAHGRDVSTKEIKYSVWDSTYTTASGKRVKAKLVLKGASGYYKTSGGRGRLSSIKYRFDTGGGGRDWFVRIEGNWRYGESRGTFNFTSRSDVRPIKFKGSWKYSQGKNGGGDWNGRLIGFLK